MARKLKGIMTLNFQAVLTHAFYMHLIYTLSRSRNIKQHFNITSIH